VLPISVLFEPFFYGYMFDALLVSVLVGGGCGAFSAYLVLRGWSLIGDTISHSVVPGVAGAYILGLPFSIGAFVAGGLAACAILVLKQSKTLKDDVVLGIVLASFFATGLFISSLHPMSVDVHSIIMGNILAISHFDMLQIVVIQATLLSIISVKWKDLMLVFFDEPYARSIGLHVTILQGLFFILLCAAIVAAMKTIGALMVIAMVIIPGATARLMTDRFQRLLQASITVGASTCFFGTYVSYFIDSATGGVIIITQVVLFAIVLFLSPRRVGGYSG